MAKFTRAVAMIGVIAAALSLPMGPVQAQARTWVSGTGNDAQPCSRTAPCKTFAGAIAKTSAGGEINCIDTGSYGAVTITKSIIISCEAGTAGVLGSGGNGITVNVGATDVVYLRGLDLDGLDAGGSGVKFAGAGVLHVEKSLIRGFQYGIELATLAGSSLYVADTVLEHNKLGLGAGIEVHPASGSANVTLARVQMTYNYNGIHTSAAAGTGPILVSITGSTASHNDFAGFFVLGNGMVLMQINRSTASQNGFGVFAEGSQGQIILGESFMSQNGTGVAAGFGGKIYSYGNNQINGNATDGTPIPSVALQ